jgi:hypothetical protein
MSPDNLTLFNDEVPRGLGNPGSSGIRGCAKDPDPPGGVLDDRQDVQMDAAQGDGFEEVTGQQALAWERRKSAHVVEVRSGAGRSRHREGSSTRWRRRS